MHVQNNYHQVDKNVDLSKKKKKSVVVVGDLCGVSALTHGFQDWTECLELGRFKYPPTE